MFVIAATHGQRDLLVRLLSNPGLKGVRCAVLYTPPHNPGAINSATNTIPPADADTVSIPDQRSAFVLSTAILNAARNGHDRIIEILLGIIPIPPPPPPPNHLINTPLPLIPPSPAVTSANINNKSRMTAAMLDLGGEVLKIACRNGHLDLVGVLLDDGRVDVSFQDQIAVRYACAKVRRN